MNAAQAKKIDHIKNFIRSSTEDDIQTLVSDKKNAFIVLHGIINSFFQKDILDKIFIKNVFRAFLPNIDLSVALNSLVFYKLINSYGMDKYVTAKLHQIDIYEMIDKIHGDYITHMFLALLLSDKRCNVKPQYKATLEEEFSYYTPLYKYWQYLNGKITLKDSEILEIINDKFKTDFQKISHITLKKHLFDPKIVEFAMRLGYIPYSSDEVYNMLLYVPSQYTVTDGYGSIKEHKKKFDVTLYYATGTFYFDKPISVKIKFDLITKGAGNLEIRGESPFPPVDPHYTDGGCYALVHHGDYDVRTDGVPQDNVYLPLKEKTYEFEFLNINKLIINFFASYPDEYIKINNLTFYPIWV